MSAPSIDRKHFLNLQARFALLGWRLDPLEGEKLLIQRWGATRVLDNLAQAEALFKMMKGSGA